MPFAARAFAKINIGLSVLRRRPDGFHDILTVFHRIGLADEIRCFPSTDLTVECTDPNVPTGPENLSFKTAALLSKTTGCTQGARICIDKHIPIGGGLGGGSSDAGTTLRLLCQLWHLDLEEAELLKIALRIGSDVPFFLHSGTALASGRGEILHYIDLHVPFSIVVCNPGIHVSTPDAYAALQRIRETAASWQLDDIIRGMEDPSVLRERVVNDFEASVFDVYPAIGLLKQRLFDSGAVFSLMSGSGSTVYGFFDDHELATKVGSRLHDEGNLVAITPPHFSPNVA